MKRIGLIGGTTWHSTVAYYSQLNKLVNERVGGVSSADCLLASVEFGAVARNVASGDTEANGRIFVDCAVRLRAAGADAIVICANTPHMYADEIQRDTGLPVIHIAEATTRAIRAANLTRVALLGTKLTMESDFYRDKLRDAGIECLVPCPEDREIIHRPIFEGIQPRNLLRLDTIRIRADH